MEIKVIGVPKIAAVMYAAVEFQLSEVKRNTIIY
jgi:hypothetical protein